MFDPEPAYNVVIKTIPLREFSDYADEYVLRPPYQRKTVWSRAKQQALLDSLFRSFYVPRLVLRDIRLDRRRTLREVVDGQQRITTVRAFLEDQLVLPRTLEDLDPELPGKRFSQLPVDLRRFVDRMSFDADLVKGIDDPQDPEHHQIASEIFWRLQQGVALNFMETAHARLASLARNFIVKYADDISFDYDAYRPIDANPAKHGFFSIIDRGNDRMQRLALLARFVLLEKAGGPTDLQDTQVSQLIEDTLARDGIGSDAYEETSEARAVLQNLNAFCEIFKDDALVVQGEPMREFRVEYFIISTYLLLGHLRKHYVFAEAERGVFADFIVDFHRRWTTHHENEPDILRFSEARQQSGNEIDVRHRVIRQLFFEFARERGHQMLSKDEQRAFDEAQRIAIYRRDDGLCQMCLEEGKPEREAQVPWRQFDADHVLPHSRGGETILENGRVLCQAHNRGRGIDGDAGDDHRAAEG